MPLIDPVLRTVTKSLKVSLSKHNIFGRDIAIPERLNSNDAVDIYLSPSPADRMFSLCESLIILIIVRSSVPLLLSCELVGASMDR
jgi:hypothetical protein